MTTKRVLFVQCMGKLVNEMNGTSARLFKLLILLRNASKRLKKRLQKLPETISNHSTRPFKMDELENSSADPKNRENVTILCKNNNKLF